MIGKTIAHYKITAKLGSGGMGDVYRANDTKLGRDVALKVLPEKLAADPERRKRFEREARAVAALKHPNIVTIFSVEEAGGHPFITMELIEGETLSATIARGGMTLERFFEIAIPLAEAVSTAHTQNVTHRDLKPANVMIEPTGVLKVLDFGLAKLLAPDEDADGAKTMVGTPSDTAVGQILGTAAYMSPEQAEGKPIDHRSDIFSLGIIFYEMATGDRPFKGDTHISTISSILKDTPPSVSQINQTLPRHLSRIVNHCLEKNADRRFQTATDVRNELEGLKKEIDSGELATDLSTPSMTAPSAPATPPPITPLSTSQPNTAGVAPPSSAENVPLASPVTPAPSAEVVPPSSTVAPSAVGAAPPSDSSFLGPPQSRRPIILGGMGLIGLIIVLGFIWAMTRTGSSGSRVDVTSEGTQTSSSGGGTVEVRSTSSVDKDERDTAVVLPFENLGPAEDAYFALGVSEEITSRLAAVSGLRVISRTSAVQYDRTGKTMRQIGEDLGVDYVLEGTVRWAKTADGTGRVRITPRLIRVADDNNIWTDTYDREINDIFEVQTDIATRVIDQLGVTLLGSERELMDDKPTNNLEAYQLYLQAISVARSNVYDSTKVALLERATELDPLFVAAWYRLTRHHADEYRFIDNTDERLSRAHTAMRRAEMVDPNHYATNLARGYYYYYGFRDYDRALAEFMAASDKIPNDAEALAAIGYIRRRQGYLEETVDFLTRATELDPQNAELWDNLSSTYQGLRRFGESIRMSERAQVLEPDNFGHAASISDSYIRWRGDLDAARRALPDNPVEPGPMYHFGRLWLLFAERDYAAALKHAEQLDNFGPFFQNLGSYFVGVIQYQAEGRENARKNLDSTVRLLRGRIETSPSNYLMHSFLGLTYAMLGMDQEAVREVKLAMDLTAKDAFVNPRMRENLAIVYATIGRHDDAIDLIEQLLSEESTAPVTIPYLRLVPFWDPLRDNPRFQALVASNEGT